MTRAGGRHPGATRVVVRLTEDAVDDLVRLARKDSPAVRWCLKKMLLIERDPMAGEALLGDLVGFRKLVVGDRHWRVVWRPTHEASGAVVVDVAEVWAAGARSDDAVYDEVRDRVARLGDTPRARALADVIDLLGKAAQGLAIAEEPAPPPEPVPPWLASSLMGKGVPRREIEAMTPEAAFERWNGIISAPRD